MGLLSRLFAKNKPGRVAGCGCDVEMQKFAEAKRREREKDIEKAWSAVKDVRIKSKMEQPDFDLSRFIFENKPYLCFGSIRYAKDSGEILSDDRFYCADHDALRGFKLDLDDLESMAVGSVLGIPSLPKLVTNMNLLEPAVGEGSPVTNCAKLELRPLTKTGRKAKYPVVVHFAAREIVDCGFGLTTEGDGSHGSIFYCQDGSMGKATVHYHLRGAYYGVRWKMVDGRLLIGSIDYSDRENPDSVRLYQAPRESE